MIEPIYPELIKDDGLEIEEAEFIYNEQFNEYYSELYYLYVTTGQSSDSTKVV